MKKDSAIVVVNMHCDLSSEEAAAKAVRFIDANAGSEGDKDEEILDTVPVLFLTDGKLTGELDSYVNEDLCFGKAASGMGAVNEAGQSLGEVLDLLDVKSVYVAVVGPDGCAGELCESLRKAGFKSVEEI